MRFVRLDLLDGTRKNMRRDILEARVIGYDWEPTRYEEKGGVKTVTSQSFFRLHLEDGASWDVRPTNAVREFLNAPESSPVDEPTLFE